MKQNVNDRSKLQSGKLDTGGNGMSKGAHGWMMTAPNVAMLDSSFNPFPAQAGEVVIEVAGCGVCHTDLGYFYDGVRADHDLPLALGHQISGRIATARGGYLAEVRRRIAEVERLYLDRLTQTRDANEGLAAFIAERPPK